MQQQLITMLELQNSMNQKVHPEWQQQGFEWYRAIWIECGELMDHYGWKWWKKQSPDRDQVLLELIDIWHFGLSSMLETHSGSMQELAVEVAEQLSRPVSGGEFLKDVEAFTEQVLASKAFAVEGFAQLMAGMDLTFDELYRQYVGKNVLNMFRQDRGYKTGEYIKVWQGREDNEHLVEVINAVDISSATFKDDVYQGLVGRYPQN